MSIEKVKAYFDRFGLREKIIELDESSATVELAAKALHTEGARIAKTLSFMVEDKAILIVTAGDTKIDNAKYRHRFGCKARMLTAEELDSLAGHAPGGDELLDISGGCITAAGVEDVVPGQRGEPGELRGVPDAEQVLGTVEANTTRGIFGTARVPLGIGEPLPVAADSAPTVATVTAALLPSPIWCDISERMSSSKPPSSCSRIARMAPITKRNPSSDASSSSGVSCVPSEE